MKERYNLVFLAEAEDEGLRADQYLVTVLPDLSRSQIQALIKKGDILINKEAFKASRKLEEGDEIFCTLIPAAEDKIEPQAMDLDIIFEDEDLVIINKPKGLVVHPAPGSRDRTLVNGLLARYEKLSEVNGLLRPGIVHRLDKDTSGLLVVAKNDPAHEKLALQLQERTMTRSYIAVVWGIIDEPKGRIEVPIGRDPKDRQKMAAIKEGKPATTTYQVLDRLADKTVVRCNLDTGRNHQIRVHMKFLGHPVIGDDKYGYRKDDFWNQGQALHAWHLGFNHPVTGDRVKFYAPLPEEFMNLLQAEAACNTLALLARPDTDS